MAARRCVQCRHDHPLRLAYKRCPWCGRITLRIASALPTDDGLDRHEVQVLALREEIGRLHRAAGRRGAPWTWVDMIDVRHPSVPPADMW